jgi:hypothetical protein
MTLDTSSAAEEEDVVRAETELVLRVALIPNMLLILFDGNKNYSRTVIAVVLLSEAKKKKKKNNNTQ